LWVGDSARRIRFKPGGRAFQELVTVQARVDAAGAITAMDLCLAREFIEHPANGIFARDPAKSFLLDAIPEADAQAIDGLAREIESRMLGLPAPASSPSGAYRTYLGQQGLFQAQFSQSRLRLENCRIEGRPCLLVSIERA
jgi:hypothetical protein